MRAESDFDKNPSYENGMTPIRDPRRELHARVDHNMTNHAPVSDEIVQRFEQLRRLAKTFAHEIVELVPESREQSLALTHAEEALIWAVAGIARNQ